MKQNDCHGNAVSLLFAAWVMVFRYRASDSLSVATVLIHVGIHLKQLILMPYSPMPLASSILLVH